MKKLKDIANLSTADLQRIADDESVMVPVGLERELNVMIDSLSFLEEESGQKSSKRRLWFSVGSVAAVVVGVVCTLAIHFSQPKDTYSDPALAYAELERTFSYMSSKMNDGFEKVSETEVAFDKTGEMLNEITKK